MMKVRLVLMRKSKRVWTAQLHQKEATLGRAHGCTVRIPSSQISRLHCRLRMANGLVTAEDLESINGTFINGKRIRDAEVVHPGDRLTLGPATFAVEYELSTTTLRPLRDEEDHEVEQTESDVYLLDEPDWEEEKEPEPPLVTAADVEVVSEPAPKPKKKPAPPPKKPRVVEEETDVETVPLAEQDDLHLSDSGTLRDFLIELDNADSHTNE